MQVADVNLAFVAADVVSVDLLNKEEWELQVYLQCALHANICIFAYGQWVWASISVGKGSIRTEVSSFDLFTTCLDVGKVKHFSSSFIKKAEFSANSWFLSSLVVPPARSQKKVIWLLGFMQPFSRSADILKEKPDSLMLLLLAINPALLLL